MLFTFHLQTPRIIKVYCAVLFTHPTLTPNFVFDFLPFMDTIVSVESERVEVERVKGWRVKVRVVKEGKGNQKDGNSSPLAFI
jgi:hypothetical protein